MKIQLKPDFHGFYLTFEGDYFLAICILRQPLFSFLGGIYYEAHKCNPCPFDPG